jgi:SAM-dependent methyltransferase
MISQKWWKKKALLGVFVRGKVYDWAHHVDTTGTVEISALSVLGKNGACAVQYEPVSPDELAEILQQIDVQFENYTFVDFGSGKGRVLLMAARYPFRHIVGVEFAKELHYIAVKNLATFRGSRQCRNIESIHADATDFPIPAGPLVIFLNNPFRDPVMAAVMRNLSVSLEAEPRDVVFVCVTRWTLTQYIERLPGVRQINSGPLSRMYRLYARCRAATDERSLG